MPIRVYDISKKLGLENHQIIAKAKALGITAVKVASSSLDKITAEFLQEEILKEHPEIASKLNETGLPAMQWPTVLTTQKKAEINISVVNAEVYGLIDRILHGGVKLTLTVAESEAGEPLRICLAKDLDQKPAETKAIPSAPVPIIDERTKDLMRAAYYRSKHKAVDGWINLADYGNAIKHEDPTFQPQKFGERSLGSLLRRADLFELRNDESNPIIYYLRSKEEKSNSPSVPPIQSSQRTVPSGLKLAKGKIHNLRLGFGFVAPDDGSENAFFHATDVEGCTIFDLKPGDAVEYEPGFNEKGPCARKIHRLSN